MVFLSIIVCVFLNISLSAQTWEPDFYDERVLYEHRQQLGLTDAESLQLLQDIDPQEAVFERREPDGEFDPYADQQEVRVTFQNFSDRTEPNGQEFDPFEENTQNPRKFSFQRMTNYDRSETPDAEFDPYLDQETSR